MTRNFDEILDAAVPRVPLVVHVPHCSTTIPHQYRSDFALSDDELTRELLLMTDHYTDELAMSAVSMGGVVFRNRVSRLVMDPERFADDSDEPMARVGMGAVYVSRQDGSLLRKPGFSVAQRARVMSELYVPYHQALDQVVSRMVEEYDTCLIVDCHSFPRVPLLYENAKLVRPEVCIGYEDVHVDESILADWQAIAERAGLTTGTNTPFPGSFVPIRYYRRDRRVRSMMIELRRDMYVDETTGEKSSGFDRAKRFTGECFEAAMSRLKAGAGNTAS